VNIYLIPYTWLRHLAMAFWLGVVALVVWWLLLTWTMLGPFDMGPSMDGYLFVCVQAAMIGGASTLGEANLRRLAIPSRLWRVLLSMAICSVTAIIAYTVWSRGLMAVLDETIWAENARDPSLASLKFRVGAFAAGGLASALGPLAIRKGEGVIAHLFGGLAAGLAGGATWYLMSFGLIASDLYLAGAAASLAWGCAHGLLVFGIPDALYAGWLRVLSANRYGLRIPVDAPDRGAKERFIGHFPRGLDLFLPVDEGVLEMHVSVAVDKKQRYTARGLSLHPTHVRRLLEKIDLSYDARRPAPLTTRLSSGDRVVMSDGQAEAHFEFLMLPREER